MSTLPRKDNFGTLTLGRNKEKKMEQLRHKLHTDEERTFHGLAPRLKGDSREISPV